MIAMIQHGRRRYVKGNREMIWNLRNVCFFLKKNGTCEVDKQSKKWHNFQVVAMYFLIVAGDASPGKWNHGSRFPFLSARDLDQTLKQRFESLVAINENNNEMEGNLPTLCWLQQMLFKRTFINVHTWWPFLYWTGGYHTFISLVKL